MFTQFYVLGPRGDSIIYRNFRNEITKSTAETFFRNVRFWNGKTQEAPPVFNVDGLHYMWAKRNGLYFVLTAISNISPCMALELLVRITKLFKDYCGVLTEESVRSNFTLIYELLDEIIEFGYPQSTTNDSLKAFVFNEPNVQKQPDQRILNLNINFPNFSSKTTAATAVDKPISFKSKTNQNDVFVDIFERLALTFNSSGQLLNQSIDGSIQMKSYLAGNPELRLGLNEDLVVGENPGNVSVCLDDCNFHECVKLGDFDNHKVLSLVPREGEFTVMNYRITNDFRPPFRIFPFFELTSSHKIELVVKIRADVPTTNHASNVIIQIPVPHATSSVSLDSTTTGPDQSTEYDDKDKVVRWRIKKFPGGTEQTIRCRIALSSPHTVSVRKEIGPINMLFEVPMYSASNLQVKYLRLADGHGVTPQRWVRYITRSASYICRM